MTITFSGNDEDLCVRLEGRLDASSAPELEKKLEESLGDTKRLVFDLEKLDYISSAGIRILLKTLKVMQKQGTMKLIHVTDPIMDIFDITGFIDIIDIEED